MLVVYFYTRNSYDEIFIVVNSSVCYMNPKNTPKGSWRNFLNIIQYKQPHWITATWWSQSHTDLIRWPCGSHVTRRVQSAMKTRCPKRRKSKELRFRMCCNVMFFCNCGFVVMISDVILVLVMWHIVSNQQWEGGVQ